MSKADVGSIRTHYSDLLEKGLKIDDHLKIGGFTPAHGHILVEPLPPDAATKGGLIIPETFQEKKSVGFVVRVSDEVGPLFEVGDLVMFADSVGYDLTLEGRDLKILQYSGTEESEVLGYWPKKLFDK